MRLPWKQSPFDGDPRPGRSSADILVGRGARRVKVPRAEVFPWGKAKTSSAWRWDVSYFKSEGLPDTNRRLQPIASEGPATLRRLRRAA